MVNHKEILRLKSLGAHPPGNYRCHRLWSQHGHTHISPGAGTEA